MTDVAGSEFGAHDAEAAAEEGVNDPLTKARGDVQGFETQLAEYQAIAEQSTKDEERAVAQAHVAEVSAALDQARAHLAELGG